jgi:hypothetical protein
LCPSGNPDDFRDLFPEEFIPAILGLITESWGKFEKPRDTHEVPITQAFCLLLQREKNLTDLPFKIRWELSLLDSMTCDDLGRADLLFDFIGTAREEVYFLFECKRLNVLSSSGRQSRAGEYVGDDGMMCFITDKYSAGLPAGGMIGYVMDGEIARAISSVGRAILKNQTKLGLRNGSGLGCCQLMPKKRSVKETWHDLPGRAFVIYHLFLKV